MEQIGIMYSNKLLISFVIHALLVTHTLQEHNVLEYPETIHNCYFKDCPSKNYTIFKYSKFFASINLYIFELSKRLAFYLSKF